jgi:hypothetical protein
MSGGARRVLTVVAALMDGQQVIDHLARMVSGLDRQNLLLVLAALAHAAGCHEQAGLVGRGDEPMFVPLPPLVAWPDDVARAA